MLRIHFTPEDLTRIKVARGPDFLWEITNSVQTLQRGDGESVFGEWRRWARPRLPESRRLLSPLLPAFGYSPDFLTPVSGDRSTLRTAVDTLLGTERPRLRAELSRLGRSRRLPGWTRALAEGDREMLGRLGEALHAYQAQALVPHWHQVCADIDADRARRMQSLMDGGTEELLLGLGPGVRWRPPVLEVDYPVNQQLHLRGRGLLLQPSFFCWPAPTTLADAELSPVLVHPIRHSPDWVTSSAGRSDHDGLGQLLGRTRAALLRATRSGCSTVEAARLLQVTHPAVSQHAKVLRVAGLITTVRTAGRAFHVATAEGRALLAAEHSGRHEPM